MAGLLAGATAHAHEFHGYASVVSDYVFRGASQSNEDPTVQGGLDYAHPGGIFAGVFASGTDYAENDFGSNPGSFELDAYLGYSRAAGRDWSWDVSALHYDFPDSTGFDYSYDELAANLHFRDRKKTVVAAATLSLDERLARYIVEGSRDGLTADLDEKLREAAPLDIINGPLMRGMDEVGRLFNDNKLIVAEVLQSAEAMKAAVNFLEPFMEKADTSSRGKILLGVPHRLKRSSGRIDRGGELRGALPA